MLEKYCDIFVIGTELPGLMTAAFLARRGLSVQVMDFDIFSENKSFPQPLCLTHSHSKLFKSLLGRLNVPESAMQQLQSAESTLQIIFPKNRIDLTDNPQLFFEELDREFPESAEKLKSFYESQTKTTHDCDLNDLFQKLLPTTWSQKLQLKKFIRQNNLDKLASDLENLVRHHPKLKSFFDAQFLLSCQSLIEKPFAYQSSELLKPNDGEIFHVYSQIDTLKKILKERIIYHEGVIIKKSQIKELLFKKGVFDGVKLENPDGTVFTKYILWNNSFDQLKDILPKKWRFRKIIKQAQSIRFEHHWFSARFKINSEYIPSLLKKTVIDIYDPTQPLTDGNLLLYQIHSSAKNPQDTFIDAHFLLKDSALEEPEDFFTPYLDSIQKRLNHLLPFSKNKLERVFPLSQKQTPSDTLFPMEQDDFEIFKYLAQKYGVTSVRDSSFYNLFKLSHKTPAPNLYITNPLILSSLGFESKLMLGLKITDIIWQEIDTYKKKNSHSSKKRAL